MRARTAVAPVVLAALLACAGVARAGTPSPGVVRAATTITGFLAAPTEQLAVPGLAAGAEVTPEGDLYTGWAEYELRFGRALRGWDQPTRTLSQPGVPLLSSALADGPVCYTLTQFAVAVGGRPVVYETVTATNRSRRLHPAQVAMLLAYTRGRQIRGPHGVLTGAFRYERPVGASTLGAYAQPGQAFSSSFRYTVAGRDLVRSGLLLARGPAAPSRPLAGAASRPLAAPAINPLAASAASPLMASQQGLPPNASPALNTPIAPHDGRVFDVRLAPRASASFTWQIPLDPPLADGAADRALDAAPLTAARATLRSLWARQEAGMMRISVPEARVGAAYRAAVAQILQSRIRTSSGWEQVPNRLQYRSFWIRDAAIATQALDLAGLHTAAAQDLAFIDRFQQSNGLFLSQPGQYDAWGQALWALAQHAALAGQPGYAAAQLGRIGAAVGWLAAATAADPLGLLPASSPGDNELAHGHITGDNLWAAAGLRSAIAMAELVGGSTAEASADAAAWTAVAQRFETALHRAIEAAVAREHHIPPVLDARGGQDWGNYWAAYPVEVLPVNSPAVAATLRWARSHMAEGLPTYLHHRQLHDYLGFRIFQTELSAGDPADAVAGLYAELTHTTATLNGWETGIAPYGPRLSATNLAPHATFAAEYVALLRNMLVADTPAGGVQLLAGASPAWLGPGRRISVTAAPTARGTISFTERSTPRGETLTWRDSLAPGTPLRWVLPWWARGARVASGPGVLIGQPASSGSIQGGAVALHGDSGSVTVSFAGHRPSQSYARTVAALDAAYRAHHLPAPLVSVP